MTIEDRARLRALLKKATPGPWGECKANGGLCGCGLLWDPTGSYVVATAHQKSEDVAIGRSTARADATLIAAAVNALPALLDEREALESRVDQGADRVQTLESEVARLRAQRDELREALVKLISALDGITFTDGPEWKVDFTPSQLTTRAHPLAKFNEAVEALASARALAAVGKEGT